MAKQLPLTEFDLLTLNPLMQIAKAVIPFLDAPLQQNIAFMVRFYELQQTMQFFKNHNQFNSISTPCTPPIHSLNDILSNDEILDTIIKYCPENYSSMLNAYKQFSKMSQMADIMGAAGFGTNSSGCDNPMDLSVLNSILGTMNNTNANCNPHHNNSDCTGNGECHHANNTTASNPLNKILNPNQQEIYEQYMKQLENLDFENPKSTQN